MAELVNRGQFESDFQSKFAALNGKWRKQLTAIAGDPPDPAKIPAEFWQQVQNDAEAELILFLYLIFLAAAAQHGADADAVGGQATSWASIRSHLLAGQYVTNSREMIEAGNDPFTDSRAERIAATETTNAAVDGAELGAVLTDGLSAKDTWFTRNDDRVCPICGPLHAKKRTVWGAEFPNGPPAHPNCRCHVDYNFDQARGAFA